MGVLVKLISELNSALGVTCVVVSHDVPEVLSIADYAYIVADRKIVAQGSAQGLQENADPRVRQFLDGIADGPFRSAIPQVNINPIYLRQGVKPLMLLHALASLGHRGIKTIATFGRAGLMLFNALVGKPGIWQTRAVAGAPTL